MNEFRDSDGNTFLMIAIKRQLFEIIVELLYLNADPRISNNDGWNALHVAAAQKDPIYLRAVLTFLKPDDLALNAVNKDRNTPLLIAVLNRHIKNTKYLLDFSSTVVNGINLHGIKGYTPLIIAVRKSSVRIINLLLSFGASMTEQDATGKSAISYALESKSPLQIYNLSNPTNINDIIQEARARATVSKAIQSGSIEWLLFYAQDLGMDLNLQESISESEHPMSPLTRAVILGQAYMVQFLLACGVYADPIDGLGNTPLIYALKRGSESIASYLVEYGANLNFTNPLTHITAIDIAKSYGDTFMAAISANYYKQ
jgi:ankyrin repeat protein